MFPVERADRIPRRRPIADIRSEAVMLVHVADRGHLAAGIGSRPRARIAEPDDDDVDEREARE